MHKITIKTYLFNILAAEIHVVTTDYDYAIIYECHHINHDGTCAPDATFIDVLSRTKKVVTNDIRMQFNTLAQKLCVSQPVMVEIVHKGDKMCYVQIQAMIRHWELTIDILNK
jgi:hypothetical protein